MMWGSDEGLQEHEQAIFIYCLLLVPTFMMLYARMTMETAAWIITFLNTFNATCFALYLIYNAVLAGMDSRARPVNSNVSVFDKDGYSWRSAEEEEHIVFVSQLANKIFLAHTVMDTLLGYFYYASTFSTNSWLHHIGYSIFTVVFVLPHRSASVYFAMFLIEELPIVLLSCKYIVPLQKYFNLDLYCNLYIFFRVVFHIIVGSIMFHFGHMLPIHIVFFLATVYVHLSYSYKRILRLVGINAK
jgi:hypothetical protein